MPDLDGQERGNYIPSPLTMRMLDYLGVLAYEAFDATAYLVGSVLRQANWRDVDVRVMLRDDEFAARFGTVTDWRSNASLRAYGYAFSALGKEITGLPIDFQIEQMTDANKDPNSGRRHALGIGLRMKGGDLVL